MRNKLTKFFNQPNIRLYLSTPPTPSPPEEIKRGRKETSLFCVCVSGLPFKKTKPHNFTERNLITLDSIKLATSSTIGKVNDLLQLTITTLSRDL